MHELSIMEGVVELLRKNATEHGINKVSRVKLIIGKLTMAQPDSLQFAFQALSQDELLGEAILEIEERGIRCTCRECKEEFNVDDSFFFSCPACSCREVEIIQGRELFLDYFEGD